MPKLKEEKPPLFLRHEEGRKYPYAKRFGAFTIRYRRGRWRNAIWEEELDEEDRPLLRVRDLFGWVELDGERIGAVGFKEHDVDFGTTNGNYIYAADVSSYEDQRIASVVSDYWKDVGLEIGAYGPIIYAEGLWIEPRHRSRLVATELLRDFIAAVYRRFPLMVLNAFPLEYESRVTEENREVFERRIRAMMRHYSTVLGFTPFADCTDTNGGWMWKIGMDVIAEPKKQTAD